MTATSVVECRRHEVGDLDYETKMGWKKKFRLTSRENFVLRLLGNVDYLRDTVLGGRGGGGLGVE